MTNEKMESVLKLSTGVYFDRIKKAYDLMVHGNGEKTNDVLNSINQSYYLQ